MGQVRVRWPVIEGQERIVVEDALKRGLYKSRSNIPFFILSSKIASDWLDWWMSLHHLWAYISPLLYCKYPYYNDCILL